MADLVLATWQGPFMGELANMSTISPGETHLVTEADLQSGHWKRAAPTPAPSLILPSPAPSDTIPDRSAP